MTQVSRKGFVDKNGQKVVIVPNVPGATAGNIASFDADGNLKDSGLAAGDVITNIAVEDLSELDNIIGTGVYHVVVYNDSGITQTREAKILFVRGSLSRGVYRLTQYLFDRYSIMSRTKAGTSPEWNEWEETNIGNVLTEPDDTPTEDSNKLVTSGGVYAALRGKAPLVHNHDNAYAPSSHKHIPSDINGVIPTFVQYDGNAIDLDGIVNDEWGMIKLCIENTDGGEMTLDVLVSGSSLPIHINANHATTVSAGDYAIVTVYKIDKNIGNTDDEHEHDLCYFVCLDGIFDNGNSAAQ